MIWALFLVFIATWQYGSCLLLPKYIPRCNFPDDFNNVEEFDKCCIAASNNMTEVMRRGVPELGFPPLEDVVIPEIKVEQKGRAVSFNATFTNVKPGNIWEYHVNYVRFNFTSFVADVELLFRKLYLTGGYAIKGLVLNQDFQFKSNFKANVTNATAYVHVKFKFVEAKNIKHLKLYDFSPRIAVEKVKADLGGLFGVKTLDKAASTFLEESTEDIIKLLANDVGNLVNGLFAKFVSDITDRIPLYDIFPKKA